MADNKTKVAVIVPASEFIPSKFVMSLTNLYHAITRKFSAGLIVTDEKPLDHARNSAVERAIAGGDPEYILFLDTDMFFPPTLFEHLLSHNGDVVSALYFAKLPPFEPIARKIVDGNYSKLEAKDFALNEYVEVAAVGMGVCLIRREVFDSIEKPYFKFDEDEKGNRIGEDVYFCEKARKAGFKVHLDTSMICRHIGGVGIGYENFKYFKPGEGEGFEIR